MKIKVKKLSSEARLPFLSLKGDAGLDLFSFEKAKLRPGEKYIFRTGITIKIPAGYAGLIWDKGGLSHLHGIKTLGGVFDSNYTGEWLIGLINLGKKGYVVEGGQKIAQVLFKK